MEWLRRTTCVMLVSLFAVTVLHAGGDQAPTGFRADYLTQIDAVESQIVSLEQAVPQEKFTWRPADGVRSVSEVYLHIAGSGYLLLSLPGAEFEPPKEANYTRDSKKWETATTNKDEIMKILLASFDHVRSTVAKISDGNLEKRVNFFGNQMTLRGLLMNVLNHYHEHLGQSVAYARMNGVVPPWTAAAEAKAREKAK